MPSVLQVISTRCFQSLSGRLLEIHNQQNLDDFSFKVDGNVYHCNKALLMAALPEDTSDKKLSDVFSGIPHGIILKLLRYFYCWQINVDMCDTRTLLQACHTLKLVHLSRSCEEYVTKNIQPQHYIGWLKFSENNGLAAIEDFCKNSIIKEIEAVVQGKDFQCLEICEVVDMIKQQDDVDKQLKAALTWSFHSNGCRAQNLTLLMEHIDITRCSQHGLEYAMDERYSTLISSEILRKFLAAALLTTCINCDDKEKQNGDDVQTEDEISESENAVKDPSEEKHCQANSSKIDRNFAESLFRRFYKMKSEVKCIDLSISLSEGKIAAHRIVLAATSSYFAGLTRTTYISKKQRKNNRYGKPFVTNLKHLNAESVEATVEYLYLDTISITRKYSMDYLKVCDYLDLPELLRICCHFTEEELLSLSALNCFHEFKHSFQFHLPKCRSNAVQFISTHFTDVCNDEDVEELTIEQIKYLLDELSLEVIEGYDLYMMFATWINTDLEGRRVYLSDFLHSDAMKGCMYTLPMDLPGLIINIELTGAERDFIWSTHLRRTVDSMKETFEMENEETKDMEIHMIESSTNVLHEQMGAGKSEIDKLLSRRNALSSKVKAQQEIIESLEQRVKILERTNSYCELNLDQCERSRAGIVDRHRLEVRRFEERIEHLHKLKNDEYYRQMDRITTLEAELNKCQKDRDKLKQANSQYRNYYG